MLLRRNRFKWRKYNNAVNTVDSFLFFKLSIFFKESHPSELEPVFLFDSHNQTVDDSECCCKSF